MTIVDYVLMALILTGAAYLLYRSVWKRKSGCPGCPSGNSCSKKYI